MMPSIYEPPSSCLPVNNRASLASCDKPNILEINDIEEIPLTRIYLMPSSKIFYISPILQNKDTPSLTKDEILYLQDSIEDLENGRYIVVSSSESDEGFLRQLNEL
ncbi:MAG: hypothetical protein V1494_04290 [Candidatus Diapherotrites archaeon]